MLSICPHLFSSFPHSFLLSFSPLCVLSCSHVLTFSDGPEFLAVLTLSLSNAPEIFSLSVPNAHGPELALLLMWPTVMSQDFEPPSVAVSRVLWVKCNSQERRQLMPDTSHIQFCETSVFPDTVYYTLFTGLISEQATAGGKKKKHQQV